MPYSKPVVGQCVDCDSEVVYDDEAFSPWTGVDGSTRCPARERIGYSPHRLPNTAAAAAWQGFYRETGQVPRHDVNRDYENA